MINQLKDIIHYQISSIEKSLLALDIYLEDDNHELINECIDTVSKCVIKLIDKMEKKAIARLKKQSQEQINKKKPKYINKVTRGSFSKHNYHLAHKNNNINNDFDDSINSKRYDNIDDNDNNLLLNELEIDITSPSNQTILQFTYESDFIDNYDYNGVLNNNDNESKISDNDNDISYSPDLFMTVNGEIAKVSDSLEDLWIYGQKNDIISIESAIDLINENSTQYLNESDNSTNNTSRHIKINETINMNNDADKYRRNSINDDFNDDMLGGFEIDS